MVTILKKGSDPAAIKEILKKLTEQPSRKGIDSAKYCGTIKIKEDGLKLQKRWRDEW